MSLKHANKCGSCARPVPHPQKKRGPPLKHCPNERCTRIYYSGNQRTKCQRCAGPLARGRGAQRAAICGKCFVDLCDLAGLKQSNAV